MLRGGTASCRWVLGLFVAVSVAAQMAEPASGAGQAEGEYRAPNYGAEEERALEVVA
mgnify:CR=1 FL=1